MAMITGKMLKEPARIGITARVTGRVGVPNISPLNHRLAKVLITPSATRTTKAGLLNTCLISKRVRALSWAQAAEPPASGSLAPGAEEGTKGASAACAFLFFFFFDRPASAKR